jgi:glycosyltransferase involved in cell wall biosynthesis
VKNEEKGIRNCLENIKDFSDDIVIVNDYSTDKTESICKQYGCRIFKLRTDDYSVKDNFGFEKAKNEWVFLLDVDERIDEELKKEISRIINSNPKEDMFLIRREEHYLYKPVYYSWQARLFRKGKAVSTLAVHEKFETDGKVGKIKKGLELHYSPQDLSIRLKKIDAYSTLEADSLPKKLTRFGTVLHMIFVPLSFFFRALIKGTLFTGVPGFAYTIDAMFYYFIVYSKYYEKHYTTKKFK